MRFGTPGQPLFVTSADADSQNRRHSDDAEGRVLYYRTLRECNEDESMHGPQLYVHQIVTQ